jgi:hypoxanthine phosphoribosyltransferase
MDCPHPPVLISEEVIQARVAELAEQISRDSAGMERLLVVGVLRGAFIFMADLVRRLSIPVQMDFIALASYDDSPHPEAVRLLMDVRRRIEGQHLLLVEDITDTGHTMQYLIRTLSARRPASLRVCTLLRNPARLQIDVPLDYVGFDIPNVWVVGYGLDLAEKYRNLPYIGVAEADRITTSSTPPFADSGAGGAAGSPRPGSGHS